MSLSNNLLKIKSSDWLLMPKVCKCLGTLTVIYWPVLQVPAETEILENTEYSDSCLKQPCSHNADMKPVYAYNIHTEKQKENTIGHEREK